MTEDADRLIGWVREAADELATAHAFLDYCDVPGAAEDGTPYSLAARIARGMGWDHNFMHSERQESS